AATDTSKSQVQRQLSQDGTVDRPDNVTSLDGRKRPAKAAPKKAATSAPVAPLSGDPCSALEALYVVRDMQIKVNKQMAEIVEQFGYTGREKEVAVLREIWSAAQETCMAADSFIEQDQDGETQ
uniref:hypothetical protein n=1 Tax=Mycobacterium sp. TaxID=1785 RepID=UPI003F9A7567